MFYLQPGKQQSTDILKSQFILLKSLYRKLTMSSGVLTTAPVGLATEAVDTTLPGTLAWTPGLPYGACEALL